MRAKFFNTAGPCRSELHYLVDSLPRLQGVEDLVADEHYFILHAPRQTGKTTYLYAMMNHLNQAGQYTVLQVNIQEAASGVDSRDAMLIAANALYSQAERFLPENERPPTTKSFDWQHDNSFRGYLEKWCKACPKPVVLFIDEADSLMDDLFLALLRQLRAGFEARPKAFPQSIALVGLRDIRDYKIRIRPESASLGTGSPFNVKTKSLFMQGFNQQELNSLLNQHEQATGQVFSEPVKQEVWRLSQGQPWLTNALANQIVNEILQKDYSQTITLNHVKQAREQLIQRRDTHLDSLVDKLREPQVKYIAESIINGSTPAFDTLNSDLAYVRDLGLIAPNPPVRFANPIYQEIIPRILSFGFQEVLPAQYVEDRSWYIKDGKLDMHALITAFRKFYRRHSEAWLGKYDFREVGRQLLLMAFLQRIINSGGQIEREMAVGNGRCDLWVEYGGETHLLELKLYYDEFSEEDGIEQIQRYMDKLGLDKGWLILFETRVGKTWEERLSWQTLTFGNKTVELVGM